VLSCYPPVYAGAQLRFCSEFSTYKNDSERSKEMQSRQIWGDRLNYVLAGLLLLVLAAELGFFARRQSQTIDEADHIHAGFVTGSAAISASIPSIRHLLSSLIRSRWSSTGPKILARPAHRTTLARPPISHMGTIFCIRTTQEEF
jgi:hypothetical protein